VLQLWQMLTERQWKHLKLLPGTASEVSRKYGMSASGSNTTLSRMEGREVRSWYRGNKRIFEVTERGRKAIERAEKGYR
jgi:predicted transcriptional regulator